APHSWSDTRKLVPEKNTSGKVAKIRTLASNAASRPGDLRTERAIRAVIDNRCLAIAVKTSKAAYDGGGTHAEGSSRNRCLPCGKQISNRHVGAFPVLQGHRRP